MQSRIASENLRFSSCFENVNGNSSNFRIFQIYERIHVFFLNFIRNFQRDATERMIYKGYISIFKTSSSFYEALFRLSYINIQIEEYTSYIVTIRYNICITSAQNIYIINCLSINSYTFVKVLGCSSAICPCLCNLLALNFTRLSYLKTRKMRRKLRNLNYSSFVKKKTECYTQRNSICN